MDEGFPMTLEQYKRNLDQPVVHRVKTQIEKPKGHGPNPGSREN